MYSATIPYSEFVNVPFMIRSRGSVINIVHLAPNLHILSFHLSEVDSATNRVDKGGLQESHCRTWWVENKIDDRKLAITYYFQQ
jgi:hypothetical protein